MYVDEPPKDGNIPDFNISKIDICPFRAYQRSFRLFHGNFSKDIHQRSRLLCFTLNDHTGYAGFKIYPFLKWAQWLSNLRVNSILFIMIHRNNQDYITAFVEGYICAIIGERMTTAKVSEAELDNAKHSAEKYVEFQIEHSDFSEEEKEAMKKDYKLWAECALQGMKKRLRDSGRLLWCASRQTIAILLR